MQIARPTSHGARDEIKRKMTFEKDSQINSLRPCVQVLFGAMMMLLAIQGFAQTPPTGVDAPYKIVNTVGFLCPGRFDYIYADGQARRLYIPRGDDIMVFDLDTLEQGKPIVGPKRAYGVALDPVSHHGFASGLKVFMWDTTTSQPVKTIDVQGTPYKNILFDPFTEHIFVFNHPLPPVPAHTSPVPGALTVAPAPAPVPGVPTPSATVLDGKDGSIVGTFALDGAPEQAVSDGRGHLYIDLKDKDSVAVVDVKTLKVTATYSLGGKGQQPCGLALDVKNQILFVYCLNSSNAVILSAADGKFIQTLPVGRVPEVGVFNPQTNEAFSSQGDGTVTIIKENSPTSFAVEQTVITFTHGRTCALDAKTNHLIVVAPEHLDKPAPSGSPGPVPGSAVAVPPVHHLGVKLHIYVVGR